MNIAVCDDDKSFCDFLEKHLRTYYDEKGISLNIFSFSSGEELLESDSLFDLVFLDVEMGKLNGIDTGSELKKRNPYSIVIVITSHTGYLDDSFRINAFRFLSKPLDILRLYKTLDDADDLIKNVKIVFYDVESGKDVCIYKNDIIFIEIEKKRTKIVTTKGTYYSNKKISEWNNILNSISFVCPHSSYIANLDYAINHTRTMIVLANFDCNGNILEQYEISIAPKKQSEIRRLFFQVLKRR